MLAEVTIRDSATATLTPMEGTISIEVSSMQQYGTTDKLQYEKSSDVYWMNNNRPKTLPCGTPDPMLNSLH